MSGETTIRIWLLCLVISAVAHIFDLHYLAAASAVVALVFILIHLVTERRSHERHRQEPRKPTP